MAAKPDPAFIERVFNKIDDDGNGSISEAEMIGSFKSFDTDGDGVVSKDEFVSAFMSKFDATTAQAERLFPKLDKDGDGSVDLSEVGVLFKGMDKDGDGTVSKAEFVEFFTALLSS